MGFSANKSVMFLASLLLTQVACASEQSRWENNNHNNSDPYSSQPYYSQPYRHNQNPISIEVIDDNGRSFAKHQHRNDYKSHRAYLEAKKGLHYKLRVRNRTNKRIAVVIAVDGRNIISGKKSHLRNNERMYVLGPRQSATYKGWRTGQNKVNRFYFTSAGNSYAAAWGDRSAMGVIAAAVYEEQPQYNSNYYSNKAAPQAKRSHSADEAGTGYGREEHSTSVRVHFRPRSTVAAKYFYKYEWRKSLCERGVINCNPNYYERDRDNRFWPYDRQGNGAYAPPPPSYHWK